MLHPLNKNTFKGVYHFMILFKAMKSIGLFFYTLLIWAITATAFLIHFCVDQTVLRFRATRSADNYFLGAWLLKWGLAVCGIRISVSGLPHVPVSGPVIVVCNHQSSLDIILLQMMCPRQITFIFKRELFKVPLLGHAMKIQRHIPVDRQDAKSAMAMLESLETPLMAGKLMVFFPEGTRTQDGQIQPFKRGAFQLAVKSGATVVPCVLKGAFEVLPKHRVLASPGRVTLSFLPPISVPRLTTAEEVKGASKDLQARCYAEVLKGI
jgi:1-acyl-sn-glycerol-3-phosphate acyltransferase